MGLTPRQPVDSSKYDWTRLDSLLKSNLKREHDSATIRISDYAVDEQEIISEAEKCGYIVSKSSDGLFLIFK